MDLGRMGLGFGNNGFGNNGSGNMDLGIRDLGFGNMDLVINGFGLHGVAGMLAFSSENNVDDKATGYNYVFEFETRPFPF